MSQTDRDGETVTATRIHSIYLSDVLLNEVHCFPRRSVRGGRDDFRPLRGPPTHEPPATLLWMERGAHVPAWPVLLVPFHLAHQLGHGLAEWSATMHC